MPSRSPDTAPSAKRSPATPCLCAAARRTARVMTRHYDDALRPAGVTAAQFELMWTVRAMRQADQARLAASLETDQTTLSRNIKVLIRAGWVEACQDRADGRRQRYSLSLSGSAVLDEATRAWKKIHAQIEDRLDLPMAAALATLHAIAEAAAGA